MPTLTNEASLSHLVAHNVNRCVECGLLVLHTDDPIAVGVHRDVYLLQPEL